MNLDHLPIDVLGILVGKLDFRSMMNLRRVCRNLQIYIDEYLPSSSVSEVEITINSRKTSLKLKDSLMNPESEDSTKHFHIATFDSTHGDFISLFIKIFQIVLDHQKSVLKKFHFNFNPETGYERVSPEFIEKFKELFTSGKRLFQVKNFIFALGDEKEILEILSVIDQTFLEKLTISKQERERNQYSKIYELIETVQWKNAKKLKLKGYFKLEPFQSYTHFEKVTISMQVVTTKILEMLKETFLNYPISGRFEVVHEPSSHVKELNQLFGKPLEPRVDDEDDDIDDCRWHLRIPDDNEHFIEIRSNYFSWFCLDRVKHESVKFMGK